MGVQKSKVSFFKSSRKFYTNYNLKKFILFNTNFWQTSYYKKEVKKSWWNTIFGFSSYERALQLWEYIKSLRIRAPQRSFNTSGVSFKQIKKFSTINKDLIKIDVNARRKKWSKKIF